MEFGQVQVRLLVLLLQGLELMELAMLLSHITLMGKV